MPNIHQKFFGNGCNVTSNHLRFTECINIQYLIDIFIYLIYLIYENIRIYVFYICTHTHFKVRVYWTLWHWVAERRSSIPHPRITSGLAVQEVGGSQTILRWAHVWVNNESVRDFHVTRILLTPALSLVFTHIPSLRENECRKKVCEAAYFPFPLPPKPIPPALFSIIPLHACLSLNLHSL